MRSEKKSDANVLDSCLVHEAGAIIELYPTRGSIMKLLALVLTLYSFSSISAVYADLYVEAAFEGGGDVLSETNIGTEVSAGGGVKFSLGIQNPVNAEETASIRLSLGYLFDDIDADNGDADFETFTFDALYAIGSGPHTFGIGGTVHIEPEFTRVGFQPAHIQYEDAFGVFFQYGYQFTPGFELGARITSIDYESNGVVDDAGSFGIFISNGF